MAKVYFRDEAGSEAWAPVGPEQRVITVGRHKDCQIRTNDNTVSRRHAEITWHGSSYSVTDLGSSNGTFYAGQRVTSSDLHDGDLFMCGKFEMRFALDEYERHQPQEQWDEEAIEEVEASELDGRIDVAWSANQASADDGAGQDFAPKTFAGFISKMREGQRPPTGEKLPQVVDLEAEPSQWQSQTPDEDDEGILLEDDQEMLRLRTELDRARRTLKDREASVDGLRIELDSMHGMLESARRAEKELDVARTRIADLEATAGSMRAEIAQRDEQLAALDEHVVALEARLEDTFGQGQVEPRTNPEGPTVGQLEETVAALDAAQAELEEARRQLQVATRDAKQARDEADAAVEDSLATSSALEAEREAARAIADQLEEVRAALAAARGEAEATRADLERLASQRASTSEALQAGTAELDRLKNELAKRPTEEEIANLRRERDALAQELRGRAPAADLERARAERDRLAAERDRAMTERDEAVERVRTMQAQVEDLQGRAAGDRSALDAEVRRLRAEAEASEQGARQREEDLRRDLEGARGDRERAGQEVQRLEDLVRTATDSAERAVGLIRQEASALQRALDAATAEVERLRAEHAQACEAARLAQEQARGEAARAEAARAEAADLRRSLADAADQAELLDARERIQELEATLDELRLDRDQARRALETATREREEAVRSTQDAASKDAARTQALEAARAEAERLSRAVEAAEAARRQAADAAKAAASRAADVEKETAEGRAGAARSAKELAAAQRAAGELEAKVAELTAENENLKLGHKAQTRRVSQLLADLRAARGDQPVTGADPAELEAAIEARTKAEQALEELRTRLERAERDAAARAAQATTPTPGADAEELTAAARRAQDAERRAAEAAAQAAESERRAATLEAALEELRTKLDTAATLTPGTNGSGGVTQQIRPLFERVNDLASVWRNNIKLIDDFIEEMQEGTADESQREEALEQIGVAVTTCNSASREMKDALREVRKVLHSDG